MPVPATPIRETFRGALHAALSPCQFGAGHVEREAAGGIRFVVEDATAGEYSDAQITDYGGRRRSQFPNRPPLRMTARAWASHSAAELKGTAGFGFWNQPVMPGQGLPRLPRCAWFFFASSPSNMAFARGVPGRGWKAAVNDFSRWPFLALAPAAPLGFLLMRIPALYRALWPLGQWAIGASEAILEADVRQPHSYRLDWLPGSVVFYVDDELVHRAPCAPRGPLGFVAWLDNQYAVVTPQGRIGMGLIAVPGRQWLALDELVIEPI
jgi:hypothetical protein